MRKRHGQTERDHKENTEAHGERMLCESIVTGVRLCAGLHVSISCPLLTLPQTDEGNTAIPTQILGKGPFSALPHSLFSLCHQ